MLKISHITSFYPESVSRPFILHVLPTSLLCFLTFAFPRVLPAALQQVSARTAALGHTTISQSQQSHSGSNTTILHHVGTAF